MELYFIRHAIAVDRTDPSVRSDEERWLTEEGVKKMECAARGFVEIAPDLDVIHTSPYVRARQTAEIVAREYESESMVRELDELMPGAGFKAISSAVKDRPSTARIALVGHEPDFSELIALLVFGSTQPDIEMKKGAICRVDVFGKPAPGSGSLIWLLSPKILRKIGSS